MVPEQRARAFARARQVRLLQRGALLDAYEVPAASARRGEEKWYHGYIMLVFCYGRRAFYYF